MLRPAQQAVDAVLANLSCPSLQCPVLEALTELSDLYLHPGIESFEYPAQDSKVKYIGALPTPSGQAIPPVWWQHLDLTKRLVLVTQGTLANRDFGQLIAPALLALRDREDLTMIVTTGGLPVGSIPVPIHANAYITSFQPYERIMPQVNLLITNGGYGTVNMAVSHCIPIVSAGLTEDKEEVCAHVEWSGVGIDLRSSQPTVEAMRRAVDQIFTDPDYGSRVQQLSLDFADHDAKAELLVLIEGCVGDMANA